MKKNGITGLILVLITALFVSNSYAQDTAFYASLTLKQSIDIALRNNIDVKQTDLFTDIARVNHNQARANLLPSLNGSVDYGFSQGRSIDPITNAYINQEIRSSGVGLRSDVVLFNGLRLQNLIKQNAYAYEAARMEGQMARDNLTLNVVLAYLDVLSNRDQLDVSRSQAEVTRKQVERMETMVKEGAVGSYQLADLKGQLAGNEIAIINGENILQTSILTLSQLLNIKYNPELQLERVEMTVPVEVYPVTADDVYNAGIQNLAIIKAVDLRIKSSQRSVKAQQGSYFPSLGLTGNISSNYSNQAPNSYFKQLDNNRGTFYGFGLQIPILNNFFVRNQVKIARINLKNAEYEAANTRITLRQNVDLAYQRAKAAFERYKALQMQVASYEESFRAAEIRFNTGVINSTEYLLVKNTLDQARLNFAQAQYELIFRSKILDFYQGRLVP